MSDIMSPFFTVLFTVPYLGNLFAAQLKRARRSGSVKHPAVSPWKEASKYDLSNGIGAECPGWQEWRDVALKCDTGCWCMCNGVVGPLVTAWNSHGHKITAHQAHLTRWREKNAQEQDTADGDFVGASKCEADEEGDRLKKVATNWRKSKNHWFKGCGVGVSIGSAERQLPILGFVKAVSKESWTKTPEKSVQNPPGRTFFWSHTGFSCSEEAPVFLGYFSETLSRTGLWNLVNWDITVLGHISLIFHLCPTFSAVWSHTREHHPPYILQWLQSRPAREVWLSNSC